MSLRVSLTAQIAVENGEWSLDDAMLGPLGRIAFAYLVLERARPVSRDELADVLWGEDLPATWQASLRGILQRVRRFLIPSEGPSAIRMSTNHNCYQLQVPDDAAIDVEDAISAIEAAQTNHLVAPELALKAAQQAVAIARRRFLPGASGIWVEQKQHELEALRVRALELLAKAAIGCRDHGAAVAAAEEALNCNPLSESAHQCLISAHAESGNRSAALRAYDRCRRTLSDELGINPSPQTEAAYLDLLGTEPEPPSQAPSTNLPASTTSFVGRGTQLVELRAIFSSRREITLVGPGGVGKTRLALELAREAAPDHKDGAWLIECAGVTHAAQVSQHVLNTLGIFDTGSNPLLSVIHHLRGREAILILDSCEHILSECAHIVDSVLRACSGLRVLVTSREPLRVPGETIWTVPPLSVPPKGSNNLDELMGYDAIRLFVDRSLAAGPELLLSEFGDAVVSICRSLDGMPIAIELAAARVRVLSLPEIASRVEDRLQFLVGGPQTAPSRHRTLRAAIDWSYDLLTPAERSCYSRLAVFVGSFCLEAAQYVWSDEDQDIFDILSALVDKSLIFVERTGASVRYRMLEAIRKYGLERLAEDEGLDHYRSRHLEWFVSFAEQIEEKLVGSDASRYLRTVDLETSNIRAALEWSGKSDRHAEALRLATSLWRFWEVRAQFTEGRAALEAHVAYPDSPASLRAKAFVSIGILAQRQGDLDAARNAYEESGAINRSINNGIGQAVALHGLGNVAVAERDLSTASRHFAANLLLGRDLGDKRMIAASLLNLGVVAHLKCTRRDIDCEANAAEAKNYYQQAGGIYFEVGDRKSQALVLENLGELCRLQNSLESARTFHEESMRIRRELGDLIGIGTSCRFLADLATITGDLHSAIGFFRESIEIERNIGTKEGLARRLVWLANILCRERRYDEGRKLAEEALEIADSQFDSSLLSSLVPLLGHIACDQGDYSAARLAVNRVGIMSQARNDTRMLVMSLALDARLARIRGDIPEALTNCHSLATIIDESWEKRSSLVLDVLAGCAAHNQDFARAAQLFGAASRVRDDGDDTVISWQSEEAMRDANFVRSQLGAGEFSRLSDLGRGMSASAIREYGSAWDQARH